MTHQLFITCVLIIIIAAGCTGSRQQEQPAPSAEETAVLIEYLEENGDLINSPMIPALINADDVYQRLHGNNIHVIDLRPPDEFSAGHIEHSVNIRPSGILDHFEQVIDPDGFDVIVLVCADAMVSGQVNAILLLLGYHNVATLRFGLSSWDSEIAEQHWLAVTSSHLEGRLETRAHPKRAAGELPAISTGETQGYPILRARARELLSKDLSAFNKTVTEITEHTGDFYKINYWPETLYNQGHLPGAVQYQPKSSLHTTQALHTLPVDQPVSIDCYTGHHSAYVTAFLRLLGYDAYNLAHGANSFIHQTMVETQGGFRSFVEEHIHHLPLAGDKEPVMPTTPVKEQQEDSSPVIGGC